MAVNTTMTGHKASKYSRFAQPVPVAAFLPGSDGRIQSSDAHIRADGGRKSTRHLQENSDAVSSRTDKTPA